MRISNKNQVEITHIIQDKRRERSAGWRIGWQLVGCFWALFFLALIFIIIFG